MTKSRRKSNQLGQPCPACGAPYEPHTPNSTICTVCSRYNAIRGNANKARRDGHTPGLTMTRSQFAEWFTHQTRTCYYCHIHEQLVDQLGAKTQIGHPLQRLGVDRKVDTKGYAEDNIVLCCFPCNKARSNTFTVDEMTVIGEAITAVWKTRLGMNTDEPFPTSTV